MAYILQDTELLTTKQVAVEGNRGTFVIEPLLPGYGITVSNSLRRILLGSIEGAAITSVRIDGATHEFATLKGVREDIVTIILNLKQLKIKLNGNEPASLILKKSGAGAVTAGDFKANAMVEFTDPSQVIAHLDKDGTLAMEIEVRKGRGYSSTESRRDEKLPLGTIAIDSVFTPVTRVNYDVENTRVGNVTNYDKITMTIITDGSITPQDALQTAAKIAVEHFSIIAGVQQELGNTEEVAAVAVESGEEMAAEAPKKRSRAKKAETEETA